MWVIVIRKFLYTVKCNTGYYLHQEQKNLIFPKTAYSLKCSCECIISFDSNSILYNHDILDWFEACWDYIQLGRHIHQWYYTRLHLVGFRYTDSRWRSVCVLLRCRPTTTWETMWLPRNVVLLWEREQCLISDLFIGFYFEMDHTTYGVVNVWPLHTNFQKLAICSHRKNF